MGYGGRERSTNENVVTVAHFTQLKCQRPIKGERKEERECQRVRKRVFTLKRRIAVIQQVLVCSTSAHRSLRSRAEHDLLGYTAVHTVVTIFIIL